METKELSVKDMLTWKLERGLQAKVNMKTKKLGVKNRLAWKQKKKV